MNTLFNHPSNAAETGNLFLTLSEKIYSIKEKHIPGKSSVPDARRVGLMNCYQFITSNVFILNIVSKVEMGEINAGNFRKIINLEEGDLEEALSDIFVLTKFNILPLIQFQIENMLKNILLHLQPSNKIKGYYNICNALLKIVTINHKTEKLEELQIPAYIRNSLHSNGIHDNIRHQTPQIFIIDKVEFRFEHDCVINCAGHGHIYLSLDNTFNIIDEILGTTEIGSIKTEIKDNFSWDKKGIIL
jgi:hypothetical protein